MYKAEEQYKNTIAVTNRYLCSRPYLEQIERICRRHPKAVIVREKDLSESEYIRLAGPVRDICIRHGVRCIAHSYTQSAVKCRIDAVHYPLHLFKASLDNPVLRQKICQINWRGVSVHSVQDALLAEKLGADYLTAGHVFATGCKPGVQPRGIEFLRQVCHSVKIPVYAIGGMSASPDCARSMILSGASGICVMSECMQW